MSKIQQYFGKAGFTPEAFYDIGVGRKHEAQTIAREFPGVSIFGCEPNPRCYDDVKGKFPGNILNTAIGTRPHAVLYPGKDFIGSSVFPVYGDKPYSVPCMSLDEFDITAGKPDNVFLWMDIDGSELDALKSGDDLLRSGRVKAINLEIFFNPPYEGWPTRGQLEGLLSEYGYSVWFSRARYRTHRDIVYRLDDE